MGNYKLVNDREMVNDFIKFLPELSENEVYYLTLLFRGKFDESADVKSEGVLGQNVLSKKKDIINTIEKFEVKEGLYTDFDKPLTNKLLGVYIKPYPLNQIDVGNRMMSSYKHDISLIEREDRLFKHKLKLLLEDESFDSVEELKEKIKGLNNTSKKRITPLKRLMYSSFSSETGRKAIIDLDIDFKGDRVSVVDVFKNLLETLELEHIYGVIETRNGLHIQINPSKMDKKISCTWIGRLLRNAHPGIIIEYNSNNLLPVPGTTQGGFVPKLHFMNKDNEPVRASFEFFSGLEGSFYTGSHSLNKGAYATLYTYDEYKEESLKTTRMFTENVDIDEEKDLINIIKDKKWKS